MNGIKKCSGAMNNSKNKLNSEIILIFYFNPNAHIMWVWEAVRKGK